MGGETIKRHMAVWLQVKSPWLGLNSGQGSMLAAPYQKQYADCGAI